MAGLCPRFAVSLYVVEESLFLFSLKRTSNNFSDFSCALSNSLFYWTFTSHWTLPPRPSDQYMLQARLLIIKGIGVFHCAWSPCQLRLRVLIYFRTFSTRLYLTKTQTIKSCYLCIVTYVNSCLFIFLIYFYFYYQVLSILFFFLSQWN